MWKAWGHFKTITRHRHLVMLHCFRVGLYGRGLLHDLSKYSPTEFCTGVKYYQGGKRSPNAAERESIGYSEAWMHHKGRNKHHFEYWTDLDPRVMAYVPFPMPTKYVVEQCMDRIAACKVYRGKDYHDGSALEYLVRQSSDNYLMHPETFRKVQYLLTMLKEKGEKETFRFIRRNIVHGPLFDKDVWPAE